MSDRISKTVLLCEDDGHAVLVRSYWRCCAQSKTSAPLDVRVASRLVHGGNIDWVLGQFARELQICRTRQKIAKTLLIVVADADDLSVDARKQNFHDREPLVEGDPLILLIPKRHVETWVCAAIGRPVNETQNCKSPRLTNNQIRDAARQIFDWTRTEPLADSTCVPSLRVALPQWKRIG